MAFSLTANTNDFQWAPSSHTGGADQPVLVMGWFHPTALATSAALFTGADTAAVRVRAGSANSALVEVTNNRTTPDVLTSASSILANNRWHFIAVLYNAETTTDKATAALWYGIGLENPPIEDSLSVTTSGVGNITTTTGNLFVASAGLAVTTGLIGETGAVCYVSLGGAAANHMFGITTAGTITQATKDGVFQSLIMPFWQGRMFFDRLPGQRSTATNAGGFHNEVYDCAVGISPQGGGGLVKRGLAITNAGPSIAVTASATSSNLVRQPRAYLNNQDPFLKWVRR